MRLSAKEKPARRMPGGFELRPQAGPYAASSSAEGAADLSARRDDFSSSVSISETAAASSIFFTQAISRAMRSSADSYSWRSE